MQEAPFYRKWVNAEDLTPFNVAEKETDLLILADRVLEKEAKELALKYRKDIEGYICRYPEFRTSLIPIEDNDAAPAIVKDMLRAAISSDVGPMAGVAGAVSEYVGRGLLKFSTEVIVENGGDIFLKINKPRVLGVFAGKSKFTKRIGIEITPQDTPIGVCTSSGTVGHSLSFGLTDATIIVSKNTALADCAATRVGNAVKTAADVEKGIDCAKSIKGVMGAVIIIGDKLAGWGEVKLVSI